MRHVTAQKCSGLDDAKQQGRPECWPSVLQLPGVSGCFTDIQHTCMFPGDLSGAAEHQGKSQVQPKLSLILLSKFSSPTSQSFLLTDSPQAQPRAIQNHFQIRVIMEVPTKATTKEYGGIWGFLSSGENLSLDRS